MRTAARQLTTGDRNVAHRPPPSEDQVGAGCPRKPAEPSGQRHLRHACPGRSARQGRRDHRQTKDSGLAHGERLVHAAGLVHGADPPGSDQGIGGSARVASLLLLTMIEGCDTTAGTANTRATVAMHSESSACRAPCRADGRDGCDGQKGSRGPGCQPYRPFPAHAGNEPAFAGGPGPGTAEAEVIKSRAAKGKANVTFTVDPQVGAQTAAVCGEWNDWSADVDVMHRDAEGGSA